LKLTIKIKENRLHMRSGRAPQPERIDKMNGETNIVSTLIVAAVLAVIVFFIARRMIRDRKAGKHSCGGGCSGCPMSGSCHKQGKKA